MDPYCSPAERLAKIRQAAAVFQHRRGLRAASGGSAAEAGPAQEPAESPQAPCDECGEIGGHADWCANAADTEVADG
jgi:hypothetical protein